MATNPARGKKGAIPNALRAKAPAHADSGKAGTGRPDAARRVRSHAAGAQGARARMPPQEKGAHAQAQATEKGASAPAMEKGVCIICGELRAGVPAKNEPPVRAARWLRSLFRQPARHTVACRGHLAEARERRAKFRKRARGYFIWAAAFFVFVMVGGLFFGRQDFSMFPPAFFGALAMACLPCFYYFPSFGE